MLDTAKIVEIAGKVARSNLKSASVAKVLAEPALDSEGHEALRITIVVEPTAAARIKGDAVLNTLVQIQDRLQQAGEDRFPMVEYATKDEFDNGDDSQS